MEKIFTCIKNIGVCHSFEKMKPQLCFFLKKPFLVRNYRGLIKTAKTVSTEKKVLVSAILPRHDKDDLGDKVHALNAGLQVLAGEEECDFQDHKAFYLSDGSVNDGY